MADEAQPTTPPVEGDSAPTTTEPTKETSEPAPAENTAEEPEKEGADSAAEEAAPASEQPSETQSTAPENAEESKPTDEATEDKAEGAATTGEAAEAGPNGTPASSKKKANGKRKSTGVPEQRSKKLNKKKSAAKITHLDAQPGDFYFARQKGYPPWPAVVCDEEMLPESLLATRPTSTKQPDGTYKEQYADGGKRVADRTFPVMYLHTNEFAWITNTDLSPLEPENCKDVTEKGKNKLLLEAYKVAAENHDLQHFKNILAEHQRQIEEEIQAQEEREAAKEAKKDKKKRKSAAAKGEEEDEEGEDKPKSSKKRKKDDGEAEGTKSTQKTPKATPKLKLNPTPKTGESGKKAAASGKATKAKGGSTKKRGAKAAASEDEEMADSPPKEAEKPLDPAEAKKQKETEVLFLRHKLQRGFLSRDQPPQEDAMETMSAYLKKLESYDDLEVSIIRQTKINKVLKGIVKLDSIPREDEFNFRGRSVDILSKWKSLLDSDLPVKEDEKEDSKEEETKPTANGVEKGDENKAEDAAEGGKDSAAPDEDVQMNDVPESTEKQEGKQDEPEDTHPKEGETAVEPEAVTAEA